MIVPVFDRTLDVARAGARSIRPEHRLLLVEGNYLLLDRPPWDALAPCFDRTLLLSVDRTSCAGAWSTAGSRTGWTPRRPWPAPRETTSPNAARRLLLPHARHRLARRRHGGESSPPAGYAKPP